MTTDAARIPLPADDEAPSLPFLIVGVGASAGGLEAYSELLGALPESPGLALLLVSHLDPTHKSELAMLLGRICKLPVHEAEEGMRVEANNVYVIPPGVSMAMTDGHLALVPRPPRPVPHMPIDYLFRSLAAIQRGLAVGVVLSGNGTDGAIGLQAIKACGGVTFAQDERTARYPGMPRAAALDGNVDHILRPRSIAAELLGIAGHPYAHREGLGHTAPPPPEDDALADILGLIRQRTHVDFSHYKQSTIRRRILRRMALRNLHEPRAYLELLRSDDVEVQNLYQDFLIRVTQFFRDTEAYDALKEKVFPALVHGRPAGSTIRIWVAGCATGEEVYSLAISLLEYLDGRPENVGVKILATDLNEIALEKARAGVYVDNIEIDVSPERLRRFFTRQEGHYQINKSVREPCIFSRHNMTADPPFSRLDLVSCRNVLIYMDAALQKRVIPLLHYALNPNGFLFLGTSENIGTPTDLFATVDPRYRIFARLPSSAGMPVDFHATITTGEVPRALGRDEMVPLWNALDVQKEADRVLLSRFAPVGVVVDEAMTVLQFRGRTAPFLEPAPGMASLDLFRMLREGLLAEVRSATAQARAENSLAVREGLIVSEGGAALPVRVEVIPFKVPPSGVRFFLVLFQDGGAADRPALPPVPVARVAPADEQVARLQQEIGALREYLQSVIEEQESTNEELKSANEEILSANEELATVNEELRHRNVELARVNSDLVNLLSGVNIPIVMVSRDLRVRRFTPPAEKLFNLIPSDIGRPLSDIKPGLEVDDLPRLISRVIDSLSPHEGEVKGQDDRWYSLRIRPYVTVDNKIDGASIVLLDIDAIRRQVEALHGDPPPPA